MTNFAFHLPVEVRFGAGIIDELAALTYRFGTRPLLVTGLHSARKSGLIDRVQSLVTGVKLFEGVPENPGFAVCEQAAAAIRAQRCDYVIAAGGGSAIDVAKAAAGLALHEGPCKDFIGRDTFPQGALPVIAIPTTAGAGSEVTPYAVLLDEENRTKATIAGRALFPAVALVDPDLTHSLPPAVTIATGLDALSQAMEGMVSLKATPLGDCLALEAIRLLRRWLPQVVHDGADAEARAQVSYAALLAGVVIAQSGTTLVHGMGYPLTLEWGIPHGLANGLLLPPLFAYNGTVHPEPVSRIADAFSVAPHTDRSAGHAVAGALYRLFEEMAVSPAAQDHGMDAAALDRLSDAIFAAPYRYRNQPGALSKALIARFYEEALTGRLAAHSQ